jgi:hypothetical protein
MMMMMMMMMMIIHSWQSLVVEWHHWSKAEVAWVVLIVSFSPARLYLSSRGLHPSVPTPGRQGDATPDWLQRAPPGAGWRRSAVQLLCEGVQGLLHSQRQTYRMPVSVGRRRAIILSRICGLLMTWFRKGETWSPSFMDTLKFIVFLYEGKYSHVLPGLL